MRRTGRAGGGSYRHPIQVSVLQPLFCILLRTKPTTVFGVGVVDDVDAQLVAGLPNLRFDARMAVAPGVADVARVVVGDPAAVDLPAPGVAAAVRRDVRQE